MSSYANYDHFYLNIFCNNIWFDKAKYVYSQSEILFGRFPFYVNINSQGTIDQSIRIIIKTWIMRTEFSFPSKRINIHISKNGLKLSFAPDVCQIFHINSFGRSNGRNHKLISHTIPYNYDYITSNYEINSKTQW